MPTTILSWFSGKARKNAEEALDLLGRSAKQGFWMPGAGRKVRAMLEKSNVANRLAKAAKGLDCLEFHDEVTMARHDAGVRVHMTLTFGHDPRKAVDTAALRAGELTAAQRKAVEAFDRFVVDFQPTWDLMTKLDATRPKPVFMQVGVSPTITATLAGLNASLDVGSLGMPEIEYVPTETIDPKTGKTVYGWEVVIHWPEGTVHDSSVKFGCCHACGHRIKNPFNWVPLYAKDKASVPHSLWVGRDCAESLFGIKLTGDVVLKGGVEAAQGKVPDVAPAGGES